MKRWPLIASFILFIVLCASAAYWAMQLFKPPVRPVSAPPRVQAEMNTDAASALFGGRPGKVAVASNYQLRGVIFSGSPSDSVAILSTDGKPAQAIRAQTDVLPGVIVKEVHRDYVLLSEGGVIKRVELPESVKDQVNIATVAPTQAVPARPSATPVQPPAPPAPPSVVSPPQGAPPPPQVHVPQALPRSAPQPQQQAPTQPAQPTTPPGPKPLPANPGPARGT
jgi:general secretion pathway protein C